MVELIQQHILTYKESIYIQHFRAPGTRREEEGSRKAGVSGLVF